MLYFLVNPQSGAGRGRVLWERIRSELEHRGVPYEVVLTEDTDHGTDAVKRLTKEFGAVRREDELLDLVVLGGDGTLNDVINGLDDPRQVRLGYIPTGSSNDFARALRFPADPVENLDRVLEGKVRRQIDLGRIVYETEENTQAERRFIVSAGIGWDAAICEEVGRTTLKRYLNKLGLGKLVYVMIAMKQIFSKRKVACTLTLPDDPSAAGTDNEDLRPKHTREIRLPRFLFIAFMNHAYEGGGFMFGPGADDSDGLLNLCVIGDVPIPRILVALPFSLIGKHFLFRGCNAYETASCTVETEEPMWIHTDGEEICQTRKVEASCDRQVLSMLN